MEDILEDRAIPRPSVNNSQAVSTTELDQRFRRQHYKDGTLKRIRVPKREIREEPRIGNNLFRHSCKGFIFYLLK